MKKSILIIALMLACSASRAQEEELLYRKIMHTADSLRSAGVTGIPDTAALYRVAAVLDKGHPAGFFEEAGRMLEASNYGEAAFLYYLGRNRYGYYNAANPAYSRSEDGALFGALASTLSEPLNLYLRTDFDNYLAILRQAAAYIAANDYVFYPKEKSPGKYAAHLTQFGEMISLMLRDKAALVSQWARDRQTVLDTLKATPEE